MADVQYLKDEADKRIAELESTKPVDDLRAAIKVQTDAHESTPLLQKDKYLYKIYLRQQIDALDDITEEVATDIASLKVAVAKVRSEQQTYLAKLATIETDGVERRNMDLTTRQLMLNLAADYRATYLVFWVKMAVATAITLFLFSLRNLAVAVSAFIVLFGIFYIASFIRSAIYSRPPKREQKLN